MRRFVGYALAPNERGFCGPADHATLRDHLRDAERSPDLARLARAFRGPLPYLRVIAELAGAEDVFDPAVVAAYWIGGDLAEAVDPHRCADALLEAFVDQPTVDLRRIRATRDEAVPTHAYHVLVTYPWIDLVAAGRTGALAPLEECRVRRGFVREVRDDGGVVVDAAALEMREGRLRIGAARSLHTRPVARPDAPRLAVGDAVAVHWDHLCDRLTPIEADTLERGTAAVVDLVDRTLLHV